MHPLLEGAPLAEPAEAAKVVAMAATTYFPFDFRTRAARAAGGGSEDDDERTGNQSDEEEEVVPFGGVPRTRADAAALRAARRARVMRDTAEVAALSKSAQWASSLTSCALLGLAWPLSRLPRPLFALGSLALVGRVARALFVFVVSISPPFFMTLVAV